MSQIYNKENVSLTEEDAAEILVKWNPTIIIENDVMRSFSKEDRRTIDIMILNRIQIKTNSK